MKIPILVKTMSKKKICQLLVVNAIRVSEWYMRADHMSSDLYYVCLSVDRDTGYSQLYAYFIARKCADRWLT